MLFSAAVLLVIKKTETRLTKLSEELSYRGSAISYSVGCTPNSFCVANTTVKETQLFKVNKADRHKSRAPSEQRPTDGPTDKAAYSVACTRLKI